LISEEFEKMVSMANRRRDKDVMKLMASKYTYELPDESKMNEIIVNFPGPEDSPYKDVSFHVAFFVRMI
jgi:ubiquitin-protein ligase